MAQKHEFSEWRREICIYVHKDLCVLLLSVSFSCSLLEKWCPRKKISDLDQSHSRHECVWASLLPGGGDAGELLLVSLLWAPELHPVSPTAFRQSQHIQTCSMWTSPHRCGGKSCSCLTQAQLFFWNLLHESQFVSPVCALLFALFCLCLLEWEFTWQRHLTIP